jgi:hypothetical protein
VGVGVGVGVGLWWAEAAPRTQREIVNSTTERRNVAHALPENDLFPAKKIGARDDITVSLITRTTNPPGTNTSSPWGIVRQRSFNLEKTDITFSWQ